MTEWMHECFLLYFIVCLRRYLREQGEVAEQRVFSFFGRRLAMDVMTHASAFLLHSIPPDRCPSLTYALVVLNQPLPRFTPLLWKHGISIPFLFFFPLTPDFFYLTLHVALRRSRARWPVGFCCVLNWNRWMPVVEQHSYGSARTAERTACTMRCPSSCLMKIRSMFDTGDFFFF